MDFVCPKESRPKNALLALLMLFEMEAIGKRLLVQAVPRHVAVAVNDIVPCSIPRVQSGGFCSLDIASRYSLSRFSVNELALVNEWMISTCFSKDDRFGVTLDVMWQGDPV